MPDTDPAASALDEIRERAATLLPMYPDSHYMIDALVQDVPRLLKAVEAALAFHEESGGSCGSCLDAYGDRIEWPCEEYRAITAALAGKEADDGQHPQDDQ